ncbi:phage tail tape measure protein [Serratia odorifera]|uniref:Phage tail tape measure protein, TP901 family n=2 Tax=Serratia odorifera TaxID=618 RepID=D4DVT0_SEROD|nr:phage tail tape measure protein [Serratia odorifera]EFE98316.1 phage tail tape measure protein, TP901 family [Serratia odorifera DSM 4582]PNK92715.1 phage tail tape measure protein [Serratia odorifera]RII73894.1 phage tail tape measure protein [Serratia odorifera]VDZ51485.1 phage tail tape measure protein, TP901 family, core region [Serratia odorifera]
MADSFQLKAIITAVDQLSGPLKGMGRNLKGFQKEFTGIMATAAAAGTAIASAFIIPINQAIAFESVMADVKKVVDFDSPQQFKQMSEDVLSLSTRLPMAAEGIGQIVAAGGQAGIAKNELLSFADSAVKMGVAFDQTADEAGQMMATWRTAFKLSQPAVVNLADKINYLGNTGPASAAKISEVVTRIGPLGEVAGVASGEIAAMGATIAGMGVESEIASTGIKNFMLSLTAGGAATASQKKALRALKISPKQLAADMQKDAKGAMLKVLDSLAKVPKAKQAAVMTALFGKESLAAIAPLLTNLELLRKNFEKVADAQVYGGSMQKEYAARAATTANNIQLFKNKMAAVSITIGDMFLPAINKGMDKLAPFIEQFRNFVKQNPETIKSIFKFGAALLGTATAVSIVTRSFKMLETVMKLSMLGKFISLMVIAGGLIASNWDTVGPIVKSVWHDIDGVAQALGGWETVLKGIAGFTAGAWLTSMIKGIGGANSEAGKLTKNLRGIANMGVITVTIAVLFDIMKRLDNLHQEAAKQNTDVGSVLSRKIQQRESDRGYTGFIPRLKELLNIDGSQNASGPLASPRPQELKVSFENAPPGMRVAPVTGASPGVSYDVGYSPFANR